MSQVSTISAARSAIVAVGFLGIVAIGAAVRGNAATDAPLGVADDYGTRHAALSAPATDDTPTGMRHGKLVLMPELGLGDDFGTRQSAAAAGSWLGAADDYGTRHPTGAAPALGPNDDFGTRNAR